MQAVAINKICDGTYTASLKQSAPIKNMNALRSEARRLKSMFGCDKIYILSQITEDLYRMEPYMLAHYIMGIGQEVKINE